MIQKIPVFVISLARAPDRRTSISQHLKSLNVDFRLVDAVDGTAMSAESRAELLAPGASLNPGEIGCYLSHINVYKIISEENIPAALILEDDARLNRRTVSLLKSGCKISGWDYCFLDCDDHNDKGVDIL